MRERLDQLYNNLDMADLHILAVDEEREFRHNCLFFIFKLVLLNILEELCEQSRVGRSANR